MKNQQLYPQQIQIQTGCSKDNKKVNLVLENQPESSERQPADKKGLRASLTVLKTGSNPFYPHSSS